MSRRTKKCWVSIFLFPQNCSEKQNSPSRLSAPQNFEFERGALTASSSGASFFAWQRRARNEWLVIHRKGPWEGYRRQPVVSFPPSFARTSRETSGYEAGALSNLGIRKAFPIGLYSTELCFHLVYMKISEIFIGLQVFYKWKGLENLAEKHNFITVEEGKFF